MFESIRNIFYALTGPTHAGESTVDEITTIDELTETLNGTADAPTLIFKHSTTCPISAGAYRRVNDYLDSRGEGEPPVRLVKVIESRPVSNALADTLGVQHQSPQILLVDKGKSVWNASHHGITPDSIRKALRAQAN